MNHYTYWLQDDSGKAYIGVRSCACSVEQDNYYSSSKLIHDAIRNGVKFTKTVLALWPTRQDALSHEILLHDIFDVHVNPNFYNRAKQTSEKFTCSNSGFKHSEKTRELFRKQKAGINHPNYGKRGEGTTAYGHRHSPEQIDKMKNFGEKNGMYGKKHHNDTIKKMSENRKDQHGENNPFYGKHHKEESKRYGEQNNMFGIKSSEHPGAKRVNTPIGIFDSLIDAGRALGVNPDTISSRARSKSIQFSEYYFIEKEK